MSTAIEKLERFIRRHFMICLTQPSFVKIFILYGIFNRQFYLSTSWSAGTSSSWEIGLAKMPSKVRKEFKRKIRRIEKLGRLSLKIIIDIVDIEKHLDKFFLERQVFKHLYC